MTGLDSRLRGDDYFFKSSAAEFMQSRSPVGCGPSSNTWPRCASQREHSTSVRVMNQLRSLFSVTASFDTGCPQLGQPVPDSNLVSDEKSGCPQQTQV